MARPARRLAANAPGPFYVDVSCIDCGTCWRWDPAHFAPGGGQARVARQPEGELATVRALLAQQACPVAASAPPPKSSNWPEQVRSVEALLPLDVRWLLPGHGDRRAFAPGAWAPALHTTLEGCQAGSLGEDPW
jgi:ferredoxin